MSFSPRQLIRHDIASLPISPGARSKIREAIKKADRVGGGKIGDLTLRNIFCDELGSNTGMSMYNQLASMKAEDKGKKKSGGLFSGLFGG
ncbi:MAG: hypothetical protein ABII72_05185 [Parcubacteria group bacterium]